MRNEREIHSSEEDQKEAVSSALEDPTPFCRMCLERTSAQSFSEQVKLTTEMRSHQQDPNSKSECTAHFHG
ncbi:hypothetical protein I79_006940 [Cricetulus griseus]|uniref:Uncharacterized protein n=1 Tax=Cricetulus griseus TaxID=10029 RepID=G3H975_CRIGR|nr:hypothetical protein I79_006940 [Cricetulus griseus]